MSKKNDAPSASNSNSRVEVKIMIFILFKDHFLESDTFLHSWEVIASILSSDVTDGP